MSTYELFYWPGIQGRGEFVRLALEDAGAEYLDVARGEGGMAKMQRLLQGEGVTGPVPFAPPFLRDGETVVSHVANILHYLGPRIGLVANDEVTRMRAHTLQLTVTDFVFEVHETHHPSASHITYEEQKPEAKLRSQHFLERRLPKYLSYFERELERNGGPFALGTAHTYVDLSLFQVVEGLRYAFPNAMKLTEAKTPRLVALRDRVASRERILAYAASGRRLAFNEKGIFRHYPELDFKKA